MTTLDALMTSIEELYKRKDGSLKEFNVEQEIIRQALQQISEKLESSYDFVNAAGRGGAGLVIELRDKQLRLSRALKLPRPRKIELIDSVKNEIEHLTTLKHDNLVAVYTAGEVNIPSLNSPYPYFVMDYVANQTDLQEALARKLKLAQATAELAKITEWLAHQLLTVAKAVRFLHARDTVHFDIKPGNVLVDSGDKAFVTDLGFAKKKTTETNKIVVGFTLFYAHPDLRMGYEEMSSENRVRRPWAPAEFRFAWDTYALGRTILQLLSQIDAHFPYAVMYDYTFVYLHLLACRMLDGRNLSEHESMRIRDEQRNKAEMLSVYLEHWLTLEPKDFADIKSTSMSQVCEDLEKLDNREYYLSAIPELSPHYPHRVQIAATAPAPFSPRVKALIEHPIFLRLRSVKQLGISETVYPGCTHTRFEHSIGAFRNCCLYLQALLHDQYNPLFRQLATTKDLKVVLVASLFHDLGHYPLAHDLEDVAPRSLKALFKHERLTQKWLDSGAIDAFRRTVRHILENEAEGWGLEVAAIKEILQWEEHPSLSL